MVTLSKVSCLLIFKYVQGKTPNITWDRLIDSLIDWLNLYSHFKFMTWGGEANNIYKQDLKNFKIINNMYIVAEGKEQSKK